jgi:hypothetical protein
MEEAVETLWLQASHSDLHFASCTELAKLCDHAGFDFGVRRLAVDAQAAHIGFTSGFDGRCDPSRQFEIISRDSGRLRHQYQSGCSENADTDHYEPPNELMPALTSAVRRYQGTSSASDGQPRAIPAIRGLPVIGGGWGDMCKPRPLGWLSDAPWCLQSARIGPAVTRRAWAGPAFLHELTD